MKLKEMRKKNIIIIKDKHIIERCSKCGRRIDREGKVPCSVWFDGLCEDCEPKD